MMGVSALQCASPPLPCTHLSSFHLFLMITVLFLSIFLFWERLPRGNQAAGASAFIYLFFCGCWMFGWMERRTDGMDGWMQGATRWWTGNMILQLCRESRICASFDCHGREGKVKRRGKRGGAVSEHKPQHIEMWFWAMWTNFERPLTADANKQVLRRVRGGCSCGLHII